jgi:hypothetical protein
MKPAVIVLLCLCFSAASAAWNDAPKFYDDDPLTVEPITQDASAAAEREIDLFFDLLANTFALDRTPVNIVRAQNVNTIDEVPDSSWFTNRVLKRAITPDELTMGPAKAGAGPAEGPWVIVAAKSAGAAPGFTVNDAKGETWFIQFDSPGYGEAATGAVIVANRLFHAIGYWQVDQYISVLRPQHLTIGETARMRRPSGEKTRMTKDDLSAILANANRREDGSYRIVAARAVPGRTLGGFAYSGTRSDDPNDIVPHEHRRELRALKVFGAWANLVDLKAGNTLDTVITENGRSHIRHYLQDVGSGFGIGANGPHRWDEGFEYLYEGDKVWKRAVSFGFYRQPWQRADYDEFDSIGRFESDVFDPRTWRSRVPMAAELHARDDDAFWAARRVMAFTDEMIRTIVHTGQYSDAAAEAHLAKTLIARKQKILQAYLPAINPIIDPALTGGTLTFGNAAVEAGVAQAPRGYRASWSRFDNRSRTATSIGETTSDAARIAAPGGLPTAAGTFIKIDVSAIDPPHESWKRPVSIYFRQMDGGWKLVGLERMP